VLLTRTIPALRERHPQNEGGALKKFRDVPEAAKIGLVMSAVAGFQGMTWRWPMATRSLCARISIRAPDRPGEAAASILHPSRSRGRSTRPRALGLGGGASSPLSAVAPPAISPAPPHPNRIPVGGAAPLPHRPDGPPSSRGGERAARPLRPRLHPHTACRPHHCGPRGGGGDHHLPPRRGDPVSEPRPDGQAMIRPPPPAARL
jgi:hypothetical protein